MTNSLTSSRGTKPLHRLRSPWAGKSEVLACVACAFTLLLWRSNADDCWTDLGCLVTVSFPGWVGIPEACWQGPSEFPAEGAVGNYVSGGALVAVQAPT